MELRILSLLPAATEMVFKLGLGSNLVGVSDDSDYPESVRNLPQVVTTTLLQDLTSRQIDNGVRAAKHKGVSIFHIDEELLKKLAPNLILSQELCEVCAIGASEIRRPFDSFGMTPLDRTRGKQDEYAQGKAARIVSLNPESIRDIFENIKLIGSLTRKQKEAESLIRGLRRRINAVKNKTKIQHPRSNILIIEWLNPIMVAGHWVPEMVEMAGGTNLISKKGEISKRISWQEVLKADPDILIIAPCGFDIVRTKQEMHLIKERKEYGALKAVRNKKVFLVDGNAYLTRPGPRIVDGIEILAEIT